VGVDVGGTALKAAILDGADRVVGIRRAPTGRSAGPGAVLDRVADFARSVVAEAPGPVVGVGVAVPGIVDATAGIGRYSANLGWRDAPVADVVAAAGVGPVRVDHDVRAAGLAEAQLGAARGCRDFLFLPIGTGIAAAMCVDGRMVSGPTGAAGELGHIPVYPDGESCACGQRGCLETYASAGAIARRYRAGGGAHDADARVIATRRDRDPVAATVWDEAVTALAIGLATYTLIADPALIVIGGGMAHAGEALLTPLRRGVADRLAWRAAPPVVAAELGDAAGAIGAALLGRDAGADAASSRADGPDSGSTSAAGGVCQ
jgi:glucokinase